MPKQARVYIMCFLHKDAEKLRSTVVRPIENGHGIVVACADCVNAFSAAQRQVAEAVLNTKLPPVASKAPIGENG